MKKVLIALAALLCLTGCSSKISYKQLTYDEFMKKMENKEDFVLVIGSSTCSNCVMFKDVIESTKVSGGFKMYYIYMDSLSDEEYAKVYSKYAITSTPTTIFIRNGEETSTYDRIIGRVNSTELKSALNKNNFIGG